MKILEASDSLTLADIDDFEKKHGCKILGDYRQFLLRHNGGRPEPARFKYQDKNGVDISVKVDWFLSIHEFDYDNLARYLETYDGRMPSEMFPFAHDAGGNLLCISSLPEQDGSIWYWDHNEEAEEGETPNYDNMTLVASSLTDFLAMLRLKTGEN